MSDEELEHMLRFEHPEKLVEGFPNASALGERWLAEVYGLTPAAVRSARHRFADVIDRAAAELLREADVAESLRRAPLRAGDVVVAFGDSITDDAQSWAYMLEALMRRAGKPLAVLNMGISGATSQDLIVRLSAVVPKRPDWIITLVGTNDAALLWRSSEALVSDQQTKRNLMALRTAMIERTDARLVWMTPPPVAPEQLREHFIARRYPVEVSCHRVQQKARLVRALPDAVVDLHAAFPTPPGDLLIDGVHPSVEGQRVITRALLDRLSCMEPGT